MAMKYANLGSRFQASLEGRGCEDDANVGLPGGADSMEAGLLEAQQVAAEVAENEQALDEAQDVAAGLEAIANDLEAFVKDGGLDAKGAVMMQRAVNSYTSRLGFAKAPVASVESFGGATSRITATTASLEGIKDILKNVWEWIKKQINTVRVKLKDYWLKNYAVAPRLSKRAEALKAKAQKATGSPKEKKITLSGILPSLAIAKRFPTDLAASYGIVASGATGVFNAKSKQVADSADALVSGMEKIKFDTDANFASTVKVFVDDAVKNAFQAGPNLSAIVDDKRHKDEQLYASAEMLGGKRVYFSHKQFNASDVNSVLNALVSRKAGVENISDKEQDLSADVTIDALPTGKIVDLCDAVIGVADLVAKYAQGYVNHEKAKDAILKCGDRMEKEAASEEDLSATTNTSVKALLSALRNEASLIDQPMQQFSGYVIQVSAGVLTVCEKSLAQYE